MKSRKSPKVSLAATGGHQALIKSLNSRLLDIFKESIDEDDNTRSTKYIAKEILKTPNRPLHIQLLKLVSEDSTFENLTPAFHYRLLTMWQKEMKSFDDYNLSVEEKKYKDATGAYVKKYCES